MKGQWVLHVEPKDVKHMILCKRTKTCVLLIDLVEEVIEVELHSIVMNSVGCFVLELRLQQILHLDISLCNPIGNAEIVVQNFDVEDANLVR